MGVEQTHFLTDLVHGDAADQHYEGAANTPVYLTSTFRRFGAGESESEPFGHGRMFNPTKEALEEQMALLEGAKYAFAFPSGTSAIGSVFASFHQGDTVLIGNAVFGGTYSLLKNIFGRYGIEHKFVDTVNLEVLEAQLQKGAKALILETPSNPTLLISDLKEIARLGKQYGVLTIVDNTFMSPYLQRPLEFGIDVVIESGTKYLGGHNDIVTGVVATDNEELAGWLKGYQWSSGVRIQPFDAYLLLRGIKTLAVRMDRQMENAQKIVEFLQKDPRITKVYFPGIEGSDGYEIQKRQAKGPGAVLAFDIAEGINIPKFLGALKLIFFGGSLGGVETLISHPASSSQRGLPEEIKKATFINDRQVRLAVGIEYYKDLINDIDTALGVAAESL